MVKSIRWTLQIWHAGLLAAVLVAFGVGAYYAVQRLRFDQIDSELSQSTQLLAAILRPAPPGPGRGPGGFGGLGRGGFGGPGRGGDFGGRPPPPQVRPPDDLGPGNGGPFDAPPFDSSTQPSTQPFAGPPRGRAPGPNSGPGANLEFQLTPALVERFSNAPPAGSYFAIWSATGDLLRSTAPDPASIPAPAPRADPYPFARGPQGPEAPIIRQRGDAREAYTYGPFGARILVGKSIQPERAELHRLAALLSGAGAAVLLIGLIGGWMLSLGVVRPIAEITAAAQSISASNLSRRIDVAGTQSELGNLAAVLNDTFARLEAAFQQQIRFTADASHELRTPLAIIHSHSQLALSRPRSAEEYQTMFQTCLRASDRMKNLVDSLLLLARADGGRLNLTLAPVDLRRIAEDAIDLLTPLAAARSITIEKKLQAAVLTADATRLAQVAANLLSNAIRYNRDGGKVEVTVSEDATDAILTISDTGLGIAPENQTHLFERFYRVDEARSRAEGGSGLGLSICKTIVQAHGGAITFQSEVNKGTTFTVRLSRAPGGLQGSRTED